MCDSALPDLEHLPSVNKDAGLARGGAEFSANGLKFGYSMTDD